MIGEPSVAFDPQLAGGDPYRPDAVADGGCVYGLTVRAASVRGLVKRFTGGPRQDDICLARHDPTSTLIAAVADGVSGARRSDVAAALAVRHAVAALTRQLDLGAAGPRGAVGAVDWDDVFGHAAWGLVEEQRRASGDAEAGVEDAAPTLSTTLLVAAVGAPLDGVSPVELATVGDSCAFVLGKRRFRPLGEASEPDDDLLGQPVSALPRAARDVRTARYELAPTDVLLLATDGFSLPLAGGDSEVGTAFARELARPPDILDFARLLDFSRSTYDDDRSLIAVWPRIHR